MQSFGAYNEEPKGQNDGIPVYAKLLRIGVLVLLIRYLVF